MRSGSTDKFLLSWEKLDSTANPQNAISTRMKLNYWESQLMERVLDWRRRRSMMCEIGQFLKT